MAEIDIQKKKPSTWLWIIGLIVLALLIWLLIEMFGGGGGGTREYNTMAPAEVTQLAGLLFART